MTIATDTFTCISCGQEKDSYFMFRARHGQTLCLWCAEDNGLIQPRGGRY